jgi:hypothetical protein
LFLLSNIEHLDRNAVIIAAHLLRQDESRLACGAIALHQVLIRLLELACSSNSSSSSRYSVLIPTLKSQVFVPTPTPLTRLNMSPRPSLCRIALSVALAIQLFHSISLAAVLGPPGPMQTAVVASSIVFADAPYPTAALDAEASLEKRDLPALATMTLQNRAHVPVALDFVYSAGAPSCINGHPQFSKDTIPTDGDMELEIPIDWQGTIGLGPEGNVHNTLIEGNTFEGDLNFDVSYVQGYSYSVTCWCGGPVVTGCSLDLHSMGDCPEYSKPGICKNPVKAVEAKAPHSFFAPCQGAAFTYPDDGRANSVRTCWPKDYITCCIGGKDNPCRAHPSQQ